MSQDASVIDRELSKLRAVKGSMEAASEESFKDIVRRKREEVKAAGSIASAKRTVPKKLASISNPSLTSKRSSITKVDSHEPSAASSMRPSVTSTSRASKTSTIMSTSVASLSTFPTNKASSYGSVKSTASLPSLKTGGRAPPDHPMVSPRGVVAKSIEPKPKVSLNSAMGERPTTSGRKSSVPINARSSSMSLSETPKSNSKPWLEASQPASLLSLATPVESVPNMAEADSPTPAGIAQVKKTRPARENSLQSEQSRPPSAMFAPKAESGHSRKSSMSRAESPALGSDTGLRDSRPATSRPTTATRKPRFSADPSYVTADGKFKYTTTTHQQYEFATLFPQQDDLDTPRNQEVAKSQFYISQGYHLNQNLDAECLNLVVFHIATEYKVLGSHFWRNDKIVDADLVGLVRKGGKTKSMLDVDQFVTVCSSVREMDVAVYDAIHCTQHQNFKPLQIFCKNGDRLDARSNVVVLISTMISDKLSATLAAKEIFYLYSIVKSQIAADTSSSAIRLALEKVYTTKEEVDDFLDFAYDLGKNAKPTHSYWKDVCVETVQDAIEGPERADIESQLRRLTIDVDAHRSQVASLSKRKSDLEIELTELKQQRLQIDEDSAGVFETYVDPTTNEVIEISKAARQAIIRVVFGEDTSDDNVMALLSKHDVSVDLQNKIGAGKMSLETFASITENQLMIAGLLAKDTRKLMALSEYVRNRIKESLQEQSRVKFALERKILKSQRDYESTVSQLKTAQNSLDANDDMAIRLQHILSPPSVETKLIPLQLQGDNTNIGQRASTFGSSTNPDIWGCAPIEVTGNYVQTIRSFRDDIRIPLRRRTMSRSSSFDFDSDSNLVSSSPEPNESPSHKQKRFTSKQSSEAICLAAFAVMLKHVSGLDKFLLGYTADFRKNGLLVGPVSDVVPIKVDMAAKGATFNALVQSLSISIKETKRQAPLWAYASMVEKYELPAHFPVQFQYVGPAEYQRWKLAGIDIRDLVWIETKSEFEGASPKDAKLVAKREWLIQEPSNCDLKLVLVETEDEIVGALHYRKGKFEEEKVLKWISKYLATLEGVEVGGRKLAISNMISRYYSSVFLGKSETDLHHSSSSMSFAERH